MRFKILPFFITNLMFNNHSFKIQVALNSLADKVLSKRKKNEQYQLINFQ